MANPKRSRRNPNRPGTSERILAALGPVLIAFIVVLQVLDWITTAVGFTRGGTETNPLTLWFIKSVGNEYLGISVDKVVDIGFLAFIFYSLKALAKTKFSTLKYVGRFTIYVVLVYVLIEVASAVLHNLIELGF